MEERRHPLPRGESARCPEGCGNPVNFTVPLPACADCGTRLCPNCVHWWPKEANFDIPLCKKDWRTRQVARSQGLDREVDT